MRVFLDANILFSAAWRAENGLLRLWNVESLHLITSSYAITEAERNLSRKRPEGVARLKSLVRSVEIYSSLCALNGDHGLPAKDIPILAAAVGGRCAVLLTGDIADFGHLIGVAVQGVRVLTASMLALEVEEI